MAELTNMGLLTIFPELILVLSALGLLISGVFRGNGFAVRQIGLAGAAVIVALVCLVLTPVGKATTSFDGAFVASSFTSFAKMLVLVAALFSLYLSYGFYRNNKKDAVCEFPVLVLLSLVGMLLMVSANGLLSLYMALELQSLPLYVLAASHREDSRSSEAGLKYFVLGALASGIILYGCSLIYGFSGTLNFDALAMLYGTSGELPIGALIGLVFLITGICFKVSAVPFHMWTPDVYEGSPMPVTAFFALAPKVAAVILFVRLVMQPFGELVVEWQQIVMFVSAASMIVGALGAIQQTNIKRLIAYSSIGHIGYILVGLASASTNGVRGILLYLMIYMILTAGIFASIMTIKRRDGKSEDINSLSGLAKSRPYMAMGIAVIIFSMAGIPPFAGFFGKFFVFYAAVKQGLYVLSVIGVLASVVAAFYYLRIIKIMYLDEAVVPLDKDVPVEMQNVAFVAAVFNVLFFLLFTPLVKVASSAAAGLF